MKKKNLSLMCAAMLAATAIPANFAMADETKDAENLTDEELTEKGYIKEETKNNNANVLNEENYKKSLYTIFAEKTVDNLYEESFPISPDEIVFAVEFLPGQYDQRADSASKCIGLVGAEENVEVKTTKVIVLKGKLTK